MQLPACSTCSTGWTCRRGRCEITAKIFEVRRDFDFQQGAEVLANRLAATARRPASSMFSTPPLPRRRSTSGTPFQGSVLQLMKVFEDAGISVDASLPAPGRGGADQASSPRRA